MSANRFRSRWGTLSIVLVAAGLSPSLAAAGDALPADPAGSIASGSVSAGKELFERKFAAGEMASRRGDGLGPVFNHVSCVACHLQGGIGGGGPIDVNVQILSAQLTTGARPDTSVIVRDLRKLHAAFVLANDEVNPNIILHRFGTQDAYAALHEKLGGLKVALEPTAAERNELGRRLAKEPLPTVLNVPPLRLMSAQRNTTALFGAGLIDQVPDSVLHALAKAQEEQGEVSGRVAPIGADKVGRFGWRGQTEHLHDFVLGACANELGLEVPGNPQPQDPLRPSYSPIGLDLTAAQCVSLTNYVAALPAPQIVLPEAPEQRELALRGREVFASVGCAACHVERIGPLDGVYSDLLLHDLGPALADPVMAAAALEFVKELPPPDKSKAAALLTSSESRPVPQPRAAGYYGGSNFTLVGTPPATITIAHPKTGNLQEFRAVVSPLDREWRTPPLWGLADSAPYLHDGRAATVVEAIALHGGESLPATKAFVELPATDRLAMLEFLSCLKAPR
jgi:CxxC motif-containing protein (DUF1111 family)